MTSALSQSRTVWNSGLFHPLIVCGIFVSRLLRIRFVYFANQNEEPKAEDFSPFYFANDKYGEPHGTGGWVLLAPYGKFPNVQGMQSFGRNDAVEIVRQFDQWANTAERTIGLPWYIGHPDHARFKDAYPDKRAYGRIKKLEDRDGGLWANVKWNDYGKKLIANESFHGHSVNWAMRKIGDSYHPFYLKSVGFTNDPGIPVPPIQVANEKTIMNLPEWLYELLGIAKEAPESDVKTTMANICGDSKKYKSLVADEDRKKFVTDNPTDPVVKHIVVIEGRATKAEADFANEKGISTKATAKITELEGVVSTNKTTIDQLNKRAQDSETLFANERAAHRDHLIEFGITTGRITAAEKAGYITEFANEGKFDETAKKILGLRPKIHMGTGLNVGNRRGTPEEHERQGSVVEEVHKLMANEKCDYDTAWARIKKTKPEMFANMRQPAGAV